MLRQLRRIVVLVLASGLACALLVSYAPGTAVDERELDRRLNEASIREIRSNKASAADILSNLRRYIVGLAKGDLGYSESNHASIAALIADRAPETLREIAIGLTGGWLLGLALAIPKRGFSILAGLLLSLPIALIAYLCLAAGAKSFLVLVIVLTPRIYRFARNLITQANNALHVEMARARGVTETRILFSHVLPSISPQLLALAAASASMAIGAAIPIEAICDVPGLGKLAWNAAMARDLPLLVNLTMLVAIATTVATAVSEIRHD
ncbi:MAG TPA: ABC transporter permease subunit [Bryobacteraceae bacterium]|nr:ABC transporter permease subunit [Bryobacteraceae bacterium]